MSWFNFLYYMWCTLIKLKPGFSGKMFWSLEIPFKTGFTVYRNEMKGETGLCIFSNGLRFLAVYFDVKYVDIFKILICFAVHIDIKASIVSQ